MSVSTARQMAVMYEEGATYSDLQRVFHKGRKRIRQLLISEGVKIRKSGSPRYSVEPEMGRQMAVMYDAGASGIAVKDKFGIPTWPQTRKVLVTHGCVIRRAGGKRKRQGPVCRRCQILLAKAKEGKNGMCGWCIEEGGITC